MTPKRSGRRAGSSTARDDILAAARTAFGDNGFDRTTMRRIADDAGVDVALISHYFGNKEGLFLAAIDFPVDPRVVLEPIETCPLDELAATVLRGVLTVWASPQGPAVLASFRQAIATGEAGLLRGLVVDVILVPVRKRLAHQDRIDLRLSLFASQMAGLLVTRHILELDPIATLPADEIIDAVAPTLQRYLTGDV